MTLLPLDNAPIRILLTGANGQLGKEVQRLASKANVQLIALGREKLNITKKQEVLKIVSSCKPTHIINAAAYTHVDFAEKEFQAAYLVNHEGAKWLAQAAHITKCKLIHISTDFVFDGQKSTPYSPTDETRPLNAYGASKLAGEQAILESTHGDALIIRTAWLYSAHGKNFLTTMIRIMQERSRISIVEDQIGTPTHVSSLAEVLLESCILSISGIYHWTDSGVASWYDFATAIYGIGKKLSLIKGDLELIPISSEEYPTPAVRPSYSVLDKTKSRNTWNRKGVHWRNKLEQVVEDM